MIFERFYKHDEFAQGTGLGLSISRVIVEKLGGTINLQSEPGKGSRFSIIFPYSSEIQKDLFAGVTDRSFSGYDNGIPKQVTEIRNKPIILIAEDNDSNYMLLKTMLEKNCQIIWVKDGESAVDTVYSEAVDLVLMDIKMPTMNGIDALIEIRKKFPDLPVIVQTAYAFSSDRELARQAGSSGFITKPIMSEELFQLLGKFIPQLRK